MFSQYIDNINIKNLTNSTIDISRKESFEKIKQSNINLYDNENYKIYNFNDLSNSYSNLIDKNTQVNADLNNYFHCQINDLDAYVVVLSNGIYYKENNAKLNLPDDVIICSIIEAETKHNQIFKTFYNKQTSLTDDVFSALNTMFFNDGIFIYIPNNYKLDKPIQIINITHGFYNKTIFVRNLFVFGKNSEANILICNHTLNNSKNFIIDVTETYLDENATLKYIAIQNEHNQSYVNNFHFVETNKKAHINSLELLLNGKFLKNNIFVNLKEEYSSVNLLGLALADKNQIFDNYTYINHKASNCCSNELYKYILDDDALGNFNGKIIVAKDAQKTSAQQTNKNICLTDNAKMKTRPQLEIYADDVKCSHGTTIGQLDQQAIFYLQQRGISQKEAQQMLMFAFANDILLEIKVETLKNKLSELINSRLKGELSDCFNCLQSCKTVSNN